MSSPATRYRIAALLEEGFNPQEISAKLGGSAPVQKEVAAITARAASYRRDAISPTESVLLHHIGEQTLRGNAPRQHELAQALGLVDAIPLQPKLDTLVKQGLFNAEPADPHPYNGPDPGPPPAKAEGEGEAERYIRPDQYPCRKPRLTLWLWERLARRLENGGRAPGQPTEESEQIEAITANALSKTSTRRIIMDLNQILDFLDQTPGAEPLALRPEEYPQPGTVYIEAHRPAPTLAETRIDLLRNDAAETSSGFGLFNTSQIEAVQSISRHGTAEPIPEDSRFEGIIFAGTEDVRTIILLCSSTPQLIAVYCQADLASGEGYIQDEQGNRQPAEVEPFLRILQYLSSPQVAVVPEPLNRAQRLRLQRDGLENPWHIIRPAPPAPFHWPRPRRQTRSRRRRRP